MLTRERLIEITKRFQDLRVAVIGDIFLDRIFYIDRALDELSVETGLVAYQVKNRNLAPGAGGAVINNIHGFGVRTKYSMGIVGDDGEAYDLMNGLHGMDVNTSYMVRSDKVVTPTYTKTIFDYGAVMEETHRIDIKNRQETPEDVENRLLENLFNIAEKVDVIIGLEQIEDGKNGVFKKKIIKGLSQIANKYPNLIIMVDTRKNVLNFRNVVLKCNDIEAVQAVYPHYKIGKEADILEGLIDRSLAAISNSTGRNSFVSWGAKGMKVYDEGEIVSIPAFKIEGPIDICGAGDSATAAIACALGAGANYQEAALIGNLTASIVIQQIGVTGIATLPQIYKRYHEYVAQKNII